MGLLSNKSNIKIDPDSSVSDKQIMDELNCKKKKLSRASEQIEGIAYKCKLDNYWTMKYLSSNVSKITGYTTKDLYENLNLSWNDLIYFSDQKKVKEIIHQAVKNDSIFSVEYRITTAKGNIKWLREDGKSFYENGHIAGIEGYIHDITEIKQKEHELEEINSILEHLVEKRTSKLKNTLEHLDSEMKMRKLSEEKLLSSFKKEKKLNKMKTEFINVLCHEFKNPLAIIKSSSQLIKSISKETINSKTFNYLTKIELNVDLLANMLDKFLFLEKHKTKNKLVNMNMVNINNLCIEIIKLIKKNAIKKFDIKYSFQAKIFLLNCDENLLKLAIKNILQNAIKYSPVGETIELKVKTTRKYFKIMVKDRGPGIKKEDVKLVFKKFYRGQNNKSTEGYGIGLSIVKKIVKLHNGKIRLDTRENNGTKISFLLPL